MIKESWSQMRTRMFPLRQRSTTRKTYLSWLSLVYSRTNSWRRLLRWAKPKQTRWCEIFCGRNQPLLNKIKQGKHDLSPKFYDCYQGLILANRKLAGRKQLQISTLYVDGEKEVSLCRRAYWRMQNHACTKDWLTKGSHGWEGPADAVPGLRPGQKSQLFNFPTPLPPTFPLMSASFLGLPVERSVWSLPSTIVGRFTSCRAWSLSTTVSINCLRHQQSS